MAIAFDSSAQGTVTGASSLSFAHTCSGADRFLAVFINVGGGAGDSVTGVTFNGDAMTRSTAATLIDFALNQSFFTYYLFNPDAATGNVVVSTNDTRNIRGIAQSYTGVDQGGMLNGATTTTSGGTISITTTVDNCWLAGGGRNLGTGEIVASTGTTQRQAVTGIYNTGDSNGPKSPAGSNSMSWTPNDADTKLFMIAFAPSGGVVAVAPRVDDLMLLRN